MVFRSSFNYIVIAKYFMFVAIVIIFVLHAHWLLPSCETESLPMTEYSIESIEQHENIVNNFFEPRKEWEMSNLGTYLFKHSDIQLNAVFTNKGGRGYYNVLIWKYWNWLKRRHTGGFRDYGNNPLYGCSVTNCRFSGDIDLTSADAVVVHIQKGLVPNVTKRNPHQLWIFWVDESPFNAFTLAKKRPNYTELSNIFNWSMTYRTAADVPIPYGRTVPLPFPKAKNITISELKNFVPFWNEKRRDVLATILISNCYPSRMRFLSELAKYMDIDIYGGCGKNVYMKKRCPGHFHSECKVISRYLFYIVMENSKCRQYLTEKSFHHAYGKGAIPVFVGPFIEDCRTLLPPNSYLHIENFTTPEHLAIEITSISKDVTKLLSYHAWRNHFEVLNEHGYFGTRSSQMCRLCEALNYNQRSQKIYGASDLQRYLDPKTQCL